jgi:hypothetical protein
MGRLRRAGVFACRPSMTEKDEVGKGSDEDEDHDEGE